MKNLTSLYLPLSGIRAISWRFSTKSTANENWSQRWVLIPTCQFESTSASMLAGAIRILEKTQTSFAVRIDGHMLVSGAANIADRVLISMSRFNQLSLSPDYTAARIGSGLRWTNMYNNLVHNYCWTCGGH
ncbi:hypothetical protein N7G274_001781 [Stereocaulon virgatum]|uniref:FAD linked oxidase N-terminal domain-containing protein n=1 Tax=Stereocaulon virgatum TaxID=373712 RepID=A0ABR4AKP1_9LECA